MKEIFDSLPKANHVEFLVDTSFLYYVMQHDHQKFKEYCKKFKVGITTFNIQEFLHHFFDVPHSVQHHFLTSMQDGLNLFVVDVPVNPGDHLGEQQYVDAYDHELSRVVSDTSDAVLVRAALDIHADVITRDKQHLFTVKLERYLFDKGQRVYNELHYK